MLIICPECELQVSDKASACPHCGYPMKPQIEPKYNKRSTHKKLPNGFGRITKMPENYRNRYRVIVTIGKDQYGHPIGKLLKPQSYFPTYNAAYAALVEYHKNPYDLDSDITVKELYEKWTEAYFKTLKSDSSIRTITSAWAYCSDLYDLRAKEIRARHIKSVMEEGFVVRKGEKVYPSSNMKSRIKSLFNLMFDYALEYELVNRNYARTFDISQNIIADKESMKRSHITFTEEELQRLWEHVELPYVNVILIQCYSGWRPQELGLIRLENVDLENWFFIGGMKTDAGTNRKVPIHPAIRDLVKAKYNEALELDSEYLFNCVDNQTHKSCSLLTYDKYRHRFENIIALLKLNPDHRAHDGRKTFVTLAKKYNVDEYAIKRIIGHNISDLTESVYTERSFEWLSSEMKKIKSPCFSSNNKTPSSR